MQASFDAGCLLSLGALMRLAAAALNYEIYCILDGSPSNVPSITELSDHTGHYGTYRFSISLASVIFRISAEKSWLELQNQLLLQPQAGSTFLSFASFWPQAASR
jgi:hypothetical protein